MNVTTVARDLGVNPDTVRFYTRQGFVKPKVNPDNGYKEYSEVDKKRLRFILSARQLGFSVSDIEQIISQADKGNTACTLVRELIHRRLEETEKLYRETARLRKRMREAVKEWGDKPDKLPTGTSICHLIENFF